MIRRKRLSPEIKEAIRRHARTRAQEYARGVSDQLTIQAEALLAQGYGDELAARVLGIRLPPEIEVE
jgi:hypothetical protein